MGNIIPSKYDAPYKYFSEITQHRELFDQLRLNDADIGKIYKCFKAIDVNGTNTVNIAKILIHLKLEKTFFTKRILSLLDADCSGDLDFGEFLVGVWNYCSIDNKYLEQFAFNLYDQDKSGIIDVSEAQYMLKDIYGEEFERSPRAKKVYQKLAELEISELKLQAFREFTAKHKAMLYPAFALQLSMKKYIVGESFWKKQTAVRTKICRGEYLTMEEIIGEELYQQQREQGSGKRQHRPSTHHADTGRRGSKTTKPEVSAPESGRRGSKSKNVDGSASTYEYRRRGSREVYFEDNTPGSRRGSKDISHEQGSTTGRKGSKIIENGYHRGGSKDLSHEPTTAHGRKGSKILDPANMSLRGQRSYQRLISGHHQDKKEKPEIRRHSRSSAVHPTHTMPPPPSSQPARFANAVNKVMMQKHVTDNLSTATNTHSVRQHKQTAKEQVWPRRNTHH